MLRVVHASQASHVLFMPLTFGSHGSHVWLAGSLARTLATLAGSLYRQIYGKFKTRLDAFCLSSVIFGTKLSFVTKEDEKN